MQCNDATQMRNYEHDEQGVPASYSVDTQNTIFNILREWDLLKIILAV